MTTVLDANEVQRITDDHFSIFNAHDLPRFGDILSTECVLHGRMGEVEGLETFSGMMAGFVQHFQILRGTCSTYARTPIE
jgi:hypothetical protein